MATPVKIIMDVDTGIDDALALLLAVRSTELELLACTTVAGNVTVEQTTRNTLAVLELAERSDIPVIRGAARPLVRRLTTATFFHGKDGLGNSNLPEPTMRPLATFAPEYLVKMAAQFTGELTIVAVGPLTNLAMALLLDPHWGRKLKQLIIMGGTVHAPGNVTPVAEANFYNDPEAAQAVINSGANITLVGLDVTSQATLPWAEIAGLLQQEGGLDPVAALCLNMLNFYSHHLEARSQATLHDPLAVAIAACPELVQTQRMLVEIETSGQRTRGQSVGYAKLSVNRIENQGEYDDAVDLIVEHPSNAEVCLQVQAAEFTEMFKARLGLNLL